ncbi:MAG: TPM domain-containing protein [Planctomycetota bacterium]|nr:TPM domain-containing protein [Planctomycetota bacterium]
MVLLVSVNDRQARIELGAGWGHEKDSVCRRVMDEHIVPRFQEEDFSGGILAGVRALDRMARGKPLPGRPMSTGSTLVWAAVGGLARVSHQTP